MSGVGCDFGVVWGVCGAGWCREGIRGYGRFEWYFGIFALLERVDVVGVLLVGRFGDVEEGAECGPVSGRYEVWGSVLRVGQSSSGRVCDAAVKGWCERSRDMAFGVVHTEATLRCEALFAFVALER